MIRRPRRALDRGLKMICAPPSCPVWSSGRKSHWPILQFAAEVPIGVIAGATCVAAVDEGHAEGKAAMNCDGQARSAIEAGLESLAVMTWASARDE